MFSKSNFRANAAIVYLWQIDEARGASRFLFAALHCTLGNLESGG